MKLKKVLVIGASGLVGLAAVLCAGSYALPGEWRVERSAVIEAPSEVIHPYVEDLRRWPEWSAWTTEKYPNLTYAYSGAERGVGAQSAWDSPETGDGRMVVTASDPKSGLSFDLFMQGDSFGSKGTIRYDTEGTATRVTWIDEGVLDGFNPIGRYCIAIMDLDAMIGADLEQGLTKLKAKAEAESASKEADAGS